MIEILIASPGKTPVKVIERQDLCDPWQHVFAMQVNCRCDTGRVIEGPYMNDVLAGGEPVLIKNRCSANGTEILFCFRRYLELSKALLPLRQSEVFTGDNCKGFKSTAGDFFTGIAMTIAGHLEITIDLVCYSTAKAGTGYMSHHLTPPFKWQAMMFFYQI